MKRLLIANRGEIARRILRTAHAMGLDTVAVYSDADAQALHVGEATQAVALGGLASADSYLRIDKLIAAAQASGADAVHPGYGFLSENADFAQAVLDAGLTWVGPPPAAIRALGSKASAKQLAQAHGVPVLPGYQGPDQSDARFAQEAERIGYPVMVKAVAGGGGRGMRLVNAAAQLPAALASARSEALSGFGSSELLIERALRAPRHVEVQVFADTQGHCIHLGERDCSVQRRHQKLIEESPSPAVDAALRERLGASAVALAQAAGYVGAGTVEFLLDGPDEEAAAPGRPKQGTAPSGGSEPHAVGSVGAFYLMEMNTRLQVEHPVTEMLTGLDLVEWQLRIARGEPLPLTQSQVRLDGHAIEVRLCAEDEAFTPHTGTVRRFVPPAPGAGLRFDHALAEGQAVSPHYDAMVGKLIAHAPTRAQALDRLARALDALVLLGLPTNRALLAACVRHPVFAAGDALIPFLAEQGEGLRAALAQQERARLASCWPAVVQPAGAHPLACAFPRPVRLQHRGQTHDWALDPATPTGGAVAAVAVDGRWHVQQGGVDLWLRDASYDPPASAEGGAAGGLLRAPFNGRVLALPAAVGAAVRQGEVLAVLESMKLEHQLAAPADGTVAEWLVAPGQQVAPGQALVALVKVAA